MKNEDEIMKLKERLPQHRFLFNDKEVFELTIQTLLSWIKLSSLGTGEKEKMRSNLRIMMEDFLNVSNYD